MGFAETGNRGNFAVIPVEGFNPERAKSIKIGMELTLGTHISSAVIFDRDYRSDGECKSIEDACSKFSDLVSLHNRKEIENFLLIPSALDRSARAKLADLARRGGEEIEYKVSANDVLEQFAAEKKSYVAAQYLTERRRFERNVNPGTSDATISEKALNDFEKDWSDADRRMQVIPGKDALRYFNRILQETHNVNVTHTSIIDAMKKDEIPTDMVGLITKISEFASRLIE
ncbi:hypothetical protein [Mesorhizobium sp. KR9-304]|uniref:hypothetical protein n=1 Tax=Mesorhizobium sp. KR9-304 TaxID=3156614 RepID=UPI0032B48D1C